jgi:rhodanese-related sulfurtransferase
MKTITPLELKARQYNDEEIQIIDIREPEKFIAGSIQDSMIVFRKNLLLNIDKISRSAMEVIVCTCGMKSDELLNRLFNRNTFNHQIPAMAFLSKTG